MRDKTLQKNYDKSFSSHIELHGSRHVGKSAAPKKLVVVSPQSRREGEEYSFTHCFCLYNLRVTSRSADSKKLTSIPDVTQ